MSQDNKTLENELLDDTSLLGDDLDFSDVDFDPFADTEDKPVEVVDVAPVQAKKDLAFFHKVPVTLTLEVASTEIQLGEMMTLATGSVVALDKLADQPLDVKVNGTLLGHAEVVVVNGKYGVRMTKVVEDAQLQDFTS
ncbi:flagellar motor switch protein FliN [Paraferrimonas sp. SM1919]|uniref:flagellar motor switch protein FliN n=1 Tax=Paraferrimonas sp. SM1919 TaxID=2662263 RepID=UPI0013D642C6|nr:flagellar motor switch protein FliN [Paraferrimonas sp. SM1919]